MLRVATGRLWQTAKMVYREVYRPRSRTTNDNYRPASGIKRQRKTKALFNLQMLKAIFEELNAASARGAN